MNLVDVKKVVLTGDRPTGPLHLGHYVGSLKNRLELQESCLQYIMIADSQALTDHADDPQKIKEHVFEVLLDYLAIGIDPCKSIIFVQSLVKALPELTLYYLNLVTWNRLKHNPTVKQEILQKGFGESIPAGFMVYPISQAADITAFKAHLVPVGADQLPMIEQTNEIVRRFNALYRAPILIEVEAVVPKQGGRLPGLDGKNKMSKSLNNAIYFSDCPEVITHKVMSMYTDPQHLRVEDPGKVKGNPVFYYLDCFDPDKEKVASMKEHYSKGGLGDFQVKKHLNEILIEFLRPIYEKRLFLSKNREALVDILKQGTLQANIKAQQTLKEVRTAMGFNYW